VETQAGTPSPTAITLALTFVVRVQEDLMAWLEGGRKLLSSSPPVVYRRSLVRSSVTNPGLPGGGRGRPKNSVCVGRDSGEGKEREFSKFTIVPTQV